MHKTHQEGRYQSEEAIEVFVSHDDRSGVITRGAFVCVLFQAQQHDEVLAKQGQKWGESSAPLSQGRRLAVSYSHWHKHPPLLPLPFWARPLQANLEPNAECDGGGEGGRETRGSNTSDAGGVA